MEGWPLHVFRPLISDVHENHHDGDKDSDADNAVKGKFSSGEICRIRRTERIKTHRHKRANDDRPESEHDEIFDVNLAGLVHLTVHQIISNPEGHRVLNLHPVEERLAVFHHALFQIVRTHR